MLVSLKSLTLAILACLLGAMLWLAAQPSLLALSAADAARPAFVHTLTLLCFLSGVYVLNRQAWRKLYGPNPQEAWLFPLGLGLHVVGAALMIAGFVLADVRLKYWGGHYLAPAGIVLMLMLGLWRTWKRPSGTPRHLVVHLPMLGLLAAMGLGALLVMDAYTGKYGVYTPTTLLLHSTSAMSLFLLPFVLVADALDTAPAAALTQGLSGREPVQALGAGLLGVGSLVAGLWGTGGPGATALGLLLLALLAFWAGLPRGENPQHNPFGPVRRMPWAAIGALLLFAAYRAWKNTLTLEPALLLATLTLTVVMLGVALPEIQSRLYAALVPTTADNPVAMAVLALHTVQLLGTGLILCGQILAWESLIQAGAGVWGLSALTLMLHLFRKTSVTLE